MIEIKALSKSFGDTEVLHEISMTLLPGNIYGFTGRNGSGKTMLMKHILGFVCPSKGAVIINGKQVGRDIDIPDRVGAIIETPGFLPEYSGYMNLKLLADISHKANDDQIKEAMKLVGLNPTEKKRVGKYSLGMRQRLGLAQALMEDPDILLLDEPMNGLDNDGVEEMRRLFLSLKEKGKLIVLASHSREDIGLLCDEIFRFDKGRLVQNDRDDAL